MILRKKTSFKKKRGQSITRVTTTLIDIILVIIMFPFLSDNILFIKAISSRLLYIENKGTIAWNVNEI